MVSIKVVIDFDFVFVKDDYDEGFGYNLLESKLVSGFVYKLLVLFGLSILKFKKKDKIVIEEKIKDKVSKLFKFYFFDGLN